MYYNNEFYYKGPVPEDFSCASPSKITYSAFPSLYIFNKELSLMNGKKANVVYTMQFKNVHMGSLPTIWYLCQHSSARYTINIILTHGIVVLPPHHLT